MFCSTRLPEVMPTGWTRSGEGTIPIVSLPERLGRLHRVDRLGVGGFSSVWLFRDDELRSDVAVKALADNWAQRIDIRERFLEEARRVALELVVVDDAARGDADALGHSAG